MTFAGSTQIGEGFAGSGANTAHVNTVLGRRGSAVETAWATALATPRLGHAPFVVVLRPNLPVKPFTLFVNKADVRGERHERLTWGPAQAGVAAGVANAVGDGVIPAIEVDDLLLLAAVWVDWHADDEDLVFANNRTAVAAALSAAAAGLPDVGDVLAARDEPSNPFFSGPG